MAPEKIALGKPYPTSVLPQGTSPAETEVPPGGCSVARQGQHPCRDPWVQVCLPRHSRADVEKGEPGDSSTFPKSAQMWGQLLGSCLVESAPKVLAQG